MKKVIHVLIFGVMVAASQLITAPAFAQAADDSSVPPPSAPPQRSAADLEKLAAPMALYPDPLVAIMLPAAAYPVEIVQAARFVANTNNLATLDDQPWDENVKAVAKFPSVIQNMSDELAWTAELGQAFIQQPSELMDAIQTLRAKAQSVGTLQTTPEQTVIVTNAVVERIYETQIVYVTNTVVQIVPASPQVIYVPVYNPVVVYAPPPTYVYSPAAPLIVFGAGIACGIIIANNHCDWHYGGVYYGRSTVVVYRGPSYGRYPYYPPPPYYRPPPYYPPPGYRPPPPGYRPPGYPPPSYNPARPTPYPANGSRPGVPSTLPANGAGGSQRWQPDQSRLAVNGGASALPSASTMEARGWNSGSGAAAARPANGTGNVASRPANGAGIATGNRPATVSPQPAQNFSPSSQPRPSNNNTPAQSPNISRPAQSQGGSQPTPNQPVNRPSQPAQNQPANRPAQSNGNQGGQGSAFNGAGNGSAARDASNRGAASRGQNSGGGGSRGGRR
jgi:hypothetical protein